MNEQHLSHMTEINAIKDMIPEKEMFQAKEAVLKIVILEESLADLKFTQQELVTQIDSMNTILKQNLETLIKDKEIHEQLMMSNSDLDKQPYNTYDLTRGNEVTKLAPKLVTQQMQTKGNCSSKDWYSDQKEDSLIKETVNNPFVQNSIKNGSIGDIGSVEGPLLVQQPTDQMTDEIRMTTVKDS